MADQWRVRLRPATPNKEISAPSRQPLAIRWVLIFQFLEFCANAWAMIVIGADVVANYLADHAGHKGTKAARTQYEAWLEIVVRASWRNPEDIKASYPKASILKASRVVFNIKGNDYRLVARVQYQAGVLAIRFFGTHAEYDKIDAETV
jgi:mRNA interferase HigB